MLSCPRSSKASVTKDRLVKVVERRQRRWQFAAKRKERPDPRKQAPEAAGPAEPIAQLPARELVFAASAQDSHLDMKLVRRLNRGHRSCFRDILAAVPGARVVCLLLRLNYLS